MNIIRLIATLMIILPLPGQAETTRNRSFNTNRRTAPSEVKKLEEKIMCAFSKNDLPTGPTNQRIRAQYVAEHLSQVLNRLEPEWRDLATQHILAQAIAETGNLRWMREQASKYASSRSRFKGRGLIQVTHRSNYAKFAGCAQTIRNNPPPRKITREQIARSPRLYRSELVQNPDKAMSERTFEGQQLNALSLVCYMVDTAERHPRLEEAMRCRSNACVNEVGVAVNRGPGALGKGRKPLGDKERIKAFRKMSPCFPTSNRSFLGV